MTFNGRKPFTQIPSQQDMLQKTKEEQPFKDIFFAATTSSLFKTAHLKIMKIRHKSLINLTSHISTLLDH
jgi:hypothetical protein